MGIMIFMLKSQRRAFTGGRIISVHDCISLIVHFSIMSLSLDTISVAQAEVVFGKCVFFIIISIVAVNFKIWIVFN